jgi:hypothetical protein
MKRYFGIIVAIIFAVVAIIYVKNKWTENATEAASAQDIARLRGDSLERIAWLRNVPDQKAYTDELQTYMRWYFKEVTEHFNKYGGNRKFDDYLTELDARSVNKKKDGDEDMRSADRKNVYEYTRRVFDQFQAGTYAPLWSATNNGIRIDIVSANAQQVGAEQKIHLPLVVWGLPREERTDEKKTKRVLVNATFKFNWRLFDEKGKLLAEMPGEGGPDSRVDWPERYVKYFPPMVVLGHYDVDKLPTEAKTAEISFTISARSPTGGNVMADFVWKLDVPAEWKLGAGETWKGATESVRSQEEIDPKKQAKK